MDLDTFARLSTSVAAGVVFFLSVLVILLHLRRWQTGTRNLLPLHVWLIAVSYLMIIAGLLLREVRFGVPFLVIFPGLLVGIYSMWILARHQLKEGVRS